MQFKIPQNIKKTTHSFLSYFPLDKILQELQSYNLSGVILLGPPGSGKDSLVSFLQKDFPRTSFFGSGDYFRNQKFSFSSEASKQLSLIANFYLNQHGLLLPKGITVTALAYELLHQIRTGKLDPKKTLFLNGWPRTIHQLELLSSFLCITRICWLDTSKKVCKERVLARTSHDSRLDTSTFKIRYQLYKEHTLDIKKFFCNSTIISICETSLLSAKEVYEFFRENLFLNHTPYKK